ncbi:unnamed protein product [Absidia cylindrospora]
MLSPRLIPSRTCRQQNTIGAKKYTKEQHKLYQTASIKFSCPSCADVLNNKMGLKTHLEQHIGLFSCLNTTEKTWSIQGHNIAEMFGKYKMHCIEHHTNYRNMK